MEEPEAAEQGALVVAEVADAGVDAGVEGAVTVVGADVFVFGLQQVVLAVFEEVGEREGDVVEGTGEQAQAEWVTGRLSR